MNEMGLPWFKKKNCTEQKLNIDLGFIYLVFQRIAYQFPYNNVNS